MYTRLVAITDHSDHYCIILIDDEVCKAPALGGVAP